MKHPVLFLLVTILLFLVSCTGDSKKIVFSGDLEENIESTISLYYVTPNGEIIVDSSPIKEGKFKLETDRISNNEFSDYPAFFKISLANNNHILTVASPGEKIHIKANAKSLVKTYTVAGGADAVLMFQLDHQLKLFVDSTDALQKIYERNQYDDSVKAVIELKYASYIKNHERFLMQFIEKNPTSVTTLTAFYQKFNRRIFIPENENLPLLKQIQFRLEARYPQNPNVIYVKERIQSLAEQKEL
jgi:hypothetical protein